MVRCRMSEKAVHQLAHRDCRNYVPLDAAKGLCRIRNEMIPADERICEQFRRLPRCRCCRHYRPDEARSQTGVCGRSLNNFMAYADMTASTCKDFQDEEQV
jgi:4-hydroxyphenylacetate decarboxylase small subunit